MKNSNHDERIGYLRRKYEDGSFRVTYELAELLLKKPNRTEAEIAEAVSLYKDALDDGETKAQFMLAMCYFNKLVDDDEYDPLRLLTDAAEDSYVAAQYELSRLYEIGSHVEQNRVASIDWCMSAACNGDARAQLMLSNAYRLGSEFLAKDPDKSLYWLKAAAHSGMAEAQCELGDFYEIIAKNIIEKTGEANDSKQVKEHHNLICRRAKYWYEMANKNNNRAAAEKLRNYTRYESDENEVFKEPMSILEYEAQLKYKPGAWTGEVECQFKLAQCYEDGRGTVKDKDLAQIWYKAAAGQGHQEAMKKMAEIEKAATPSSSTVAKRGAGDSTTSASKRGNHHGM